MLQRLPQDVLVHVLSQASAVTLLAASRVSKALHAVAGDRRCWQALIERNHPAVLEILFEGKLLPLQGLEGLTWAQQYFVFVRNWKCLAQQRCPGRLLLKIHSSASGQPSLDSCGIYDATAYAPLHPGLEFIVEDAAEEEDSTATFKAAAHSRHAKAILRSLAVPGLERLTCNGEESTQLTLLRARSRRRRWLFELRRWAPYAAPLLLVLGLLVRSVMLERTLPVILAAALELMMWSVPPAPWLTAFIAIGLALYEWSCEGVGALALVVLLIALRSGAVEVT